MNFPNLPVHAGLLRSPSQSDERGTVALLTALLMIPLLGMLALVIDLGLVYAERRQAQNVVDSAAVAAAQVIGHHLVAGGESDAAVAQAIEDVARHSSGGFAGRSTAVYVGASGSSLGVRVGSGTLPPDARGVRLGTRQSMPTFFAPALGVRFLDVGAAAAAVSLEVTGVSQSLPDFAPYAVWAGEERYRCPDGAYGCGLLGQVVTYRSNQYIHTNVSAGNPRWSGNSNNFKGYFHDPRGVLTTGDAIVVTKGGNAFGLEPLDMMHAHFVAGVPVIMPVIDLEDGNGSDLQLHISAFVAVRLLTDPGPPGSSPGTGQVVAGAATYGALTGGAAPAPGVPALRAAHLVQ